MCDFNENVVTEEVVEEVAEAAAPAVEIEPLFDEDVDFDTFSKSDFRVVKVKEYSAVKKSKKFLHFVLDDCTGTDRSAVHQINGEEKLNLIMVSDEIPAGAKLY